MKPEETSSDYLNRARQYATALANIGEPMKEKDLVMLVVSGLREDYNGVKSTALSRQLAFNELHALFADHEYMLRKNAHVVQPSQAFLAVAMSQQPLLRSDLKLSRPCNSLRHSWAYKSSAPAGFLYLPQQVWSGSTSQPPGAAPQPWHKPRYP